MPTPTTFVPEMVSKGLFTDAQVALDDISHVLSVTAPAARITSGYDLGSIGRVTFTVPALTGNYWCSATVTKVSEEASPGWRARMLSPSYTPENLRSRSGNQVWQLPAIAGSTQLDLLSGTSFAGSLLDVQIVAMAGHLARPADVYVAAGQSLMACTTASLDVQFPLDGWSDPRLFYFPGSTYAGQGTVIGKRDALRAPLQMNADTGGAITVGMRSSGVSPAVHFAKEMLNSLASGRSIVIIAAAVSSTGLLASDAAWNRGGSNPFAYNHMMGLVSGAMPQLPAGSRIKGVLWAQGEADTSADMSAYAAGFANLRTGAEASWYGAGYTTGPKVPWVIITAPPDASRTNQAHFIDTQTRMDQNSGHATAQPGVFAVARVASGMEDSTHPVAASQRLAGKAAAIALQNRVPVF